jgi:16S rRNA U516 pseudouridylate synthase RsuA-like enzyme
MHPESEHGLRVQLATALREHDLTQEALGAAFEDLRAADKRAARAEAERDQLQEALAAARRECEGLRVHLRKMVDLADYHVNEIECIAENDFTPENITRAQMARVSLNEAEALAAPAAAAGEEGT